MKRMWTVKIGVTVAGPFSVAWSISPRMRNSMAVDKRQGRAGENLARDKEIVGCRFASRYMTDQRKVACRGNMAGLFGSQL